MTRSFAAALAVGLLTAVGCDGLLFDPNVARISAVALATAPADADGAPVFVRLTTPFDTTETEASAGPFPRTLATASEIGVSTTEGTFDGEPLVVEVLRCDAACATSSVIGRATVQPDVWRGSERTVDAGGIAVRLPFRKTSS